MACAGDAEHRIDRSARRAFQIAVRAAFAHAARSVGRRIVVSVTQISGSAASTARRCRVQSPPARPANSSAAAAEIPGFDAVPNPRSRPPGCCSAPPQQRVPARAPGLINHAEAIDAAASQSSTASSVPNAFVVARPASRSSAGQTMFSVYPSFAHSEVVPARGVRGIASRKSATSGIPPNRPSCRALELARR